LEDTGSDHVVEYYQNSIVREEISAFCKGRWVAIHCEKKTPQGVPYLVRYKGWKRKIPLTISSEADVTKLLTMFSKLSPRTFYGTINEYSKLDSQEELDDIDNIQRSSPIWDIDNLPDDWETTIKTAKLILEFLHDNGVKKSAFVKWSGKGAHVHLNPGAVSDSMYLRIGPLNIAYAVVEYVIRSLKPQFRKLVESAKSSHLSVENKIDPKRIFTAPLSLHRNLFRACVCILPEDLNSFEISWTNPQSFRHNNSWTRFAKGEGDNFAEQAYGKIGPCPYTGRLYQKRSLPLNI
jgi:hypothetical protein